MFGNVAKHVFIVCFILLNRNYKPKEEKIRSVVKAPNLMSLKMFYCSSWCEIGKMTFTPLSHDRYGISLGCLSRRFDCYTASLHPAMKTIVYAICSTVVRCYWCISIVIVIPNV